MPTPHDVSSLVAEAALDRPDILAVVEAEGRSVTWAQLEEEVARVATGLGAAGLVAGQRVLLALGNRIEFVTAYLGVLRAQVVAVPVNPRATSGELARMIADSGSRIVVADDETIATVRDACRLVRAARSGETDELDADLVERSPTTRSGRPRRSRCRRCRTRRSWPACSTPAVRRAGRVRRCSPTAR
jgi:long-chain acyl-CoA synthetase